MYGDGETVGDFPPVESADSVVPPPIVEEYLLTLILAISDQLVPFHSSTHVQKELFGEEFEDGTISFGALERANRGTLLIDEVSEIPHETQANVLRVLIDQKFKRLNGVKDINVNIRLKYPFFNQILTVKYALI